MSLIARNIHKQILHIVRYPKNYPGGAEKVAHSLAEYLNKYGWKSDVLSFSRSPSIVQRLVKNYIIPKPSEIVEKIEEFQPDVIHIHALRNGYAIMAAAIAKKMGIPYIIQPHGACAVSRDLGALGLVKRIFDSSIGKTIMENAALVVALTEEEKQNVQRIAPLSRVVKIPNGLGEEDFKKPDKEKIEQFREKTDAEHIVVTVARIHPVKAIPEIIPAIARAQEKVGKITYIIGGPDDGDLQRVKNVADKYNVDVRTIGPVYGDTKRALMAAGDAFILPSRYEGFPLTIIEAMAQGTTPVVSDRGGSKEIVREYGYVFRFGNIESAADAIINALRSPTDKKDLIKYARNFLWDNIVKKKYMPIVEAVLQH